MKKKYPEKKKLLFVLANLGAHKCGHVLKILEDPRISKLFTPSNSP